MPPPQDHLDDVIRRIYVRPVDEAVAARHLAAIAAAAPRVEQDVPLGSTHGRRRRRRSLGAWRPALAAGLAVVALPSGLAFAGVDLPDPVTAPFEAVGVDLPNQVDDATGVPRNASPDGDDRGPDGSPATAPGSDGRKDEKGSGSKSGDSKRGTRRNETRSKGRRGEEASGGKRKGDERSRSDEAPARGPRESGNAGGSSSSNNGKRVGQGSGGSAGKSSSAAERRTNRGATRKPVKKKAPARVKPSPPAARGPKPKDDTTTAPTTTDTTTTSTDGTADTGALTGRRTTTTDADAAGG